MRVIGYVRVSIAVDGLHRWPEAPKAVEYLRNEHRHKFFIDVYINESYDRELEFFMTADDVMGALERLYEKKGSLINFGNDSCEEISRKIMYILLDEGYDVFRVEVSEDGINAGGVYREGGVCACQK